MFGAWIGFWEVGTWCRKRMPRASRTVRRGLSRV